MRFTVTSGLLLALAAVSPVSAQFTHELSFVPGGRILTPEGALLPGPVAGVTPTPQGFLVSSHTHLGLLEATGVTQATRRVTIGVGEEGEAESHPHPRAVDRNQTGTTVWHDAEMNALVGVRANQSYPVVWAEIRFQPISVIALDDSTMVVSGSDRAPMAFGYPLHAWRPNRRLPSFGAPADVAVGSFEGAAEPVLLAPGRQGGFWAVSVYEPRLEFYGSDLEHRFSLEFDAPWLTRRGGTGTPDTPPGSSLLDMVEAEDGNIWIIAQVPDPNWREAWTGVELNESGAVDPILLSRRRLFDTVITVIDPSTGTTLASHTLDDVVIAIAPDNQLVTMDRIDEYHADVRILKASFTPRRIDP